MKILVCISCVPDTTSKINFKNNNTIFDEQGVQFVINPNDEFGLTRAIWFKEKIGATVDVLHVGEDRLILHLEKHLLSAPTKPFESIPLLQMLLSLPIKFQNISR